jgi:hypothetical protein
MTSSETEPTTFWLVAKRLNHLRYRLPLLQTTTVEKSGFFICISQLKPLKLCCVATMQINHLLKYMCPYLNPKTQCSGCLKSYHDAWVGSRRLFIDRLCYDFLSWSSIRLWSYRSNYKMCLLHLKSSSANNKGNKNNTGFHNK